MLLLQQAHKIVLFELRRSNDIAKVKLIDYKQRTTLQNIKFFGHTFDLRYNADCMIHIHSEP
ncbi:hypothetical protein HMPREF9370_0625 [Neisseria wadsworthii 9715]|uniref:Uncharacterized protein n=1 Tax=Neisseria wadsworthii 9715 TaxID=1030841 RepID=G4CNG6_9NEIS|nr:hypothetical protein HMPREF9370_0625 [Neisseria wadsworthii 9715]